MRCTDSERSGFASGIFTAWPPDGRHPCKPATRHNYSLSLYGAQPDSPTSTHHGVRRLISTELPRFPNRGDRVYSMAPARPPRPFWSSLRQPRVQLSSRFYSAPANASIPTAKKKYVPTSGTYPKGFRASGIVVGVKPGNTTKPDLAFLASDTPCAAAAVFTKNKFQAGPVTVSRELLQKKNNRGIQSVIVNSGCANAVTGKGGMEDAAKMAHAADDCVGKHGGTIVMSTGVIGQRLVVKKWRCHW